jgi:polyvinyl alcohol dehydrogenase (cytochrome)
MPTRAHASRRALAAALLLGGMQAALADQSVSAGPEKNACTARAEPVALSSAQWNGWGHGLDNTRYQAEPALRAGDVAKLALKWSYGYQGGNEFGQPTIVDGRIFVSSASGRIYSLDARTGCTYWTFDAPVGSRTAVTVGELGVSRRAVAPKITHRIKRSLAHLDVIKAPSAVFFGDDRGAAYALDAQRGTLLWKTQVEAHPSARIIAAPALYDDRLYVAVASGEDRSAAADPGYGCCTFRGSVAALDMASGRIAWHAYTVLETPVATRKSSTGVQEFGPAGGPISGAPTIDPKRHLLYVGTGGSFTSLEQSLTDAIVAFDSNDGKLRWVKQLTRTGEVGSSGFLAAPILRSLPNNVDVVVAAQKSGVVYGLDPDHGGEIRWQTRITDAGGAASAASPSVAPPPAGGVAWGAAADYRNAYVASTGTLAQPANPSGSITTLDLKTGLPRWHVAAPSPACSPGLPACVHGLSQAVSVIPGVAFAGSLDGHLRAFSSIDGKILWDFDTVKPYQTQNGLNVSGGVLDHGGATIVNGIVYVNSGNVLLAFSVDGK